MSDTKGPNNLREHAQSQVARLTEEVEVERAERRRHQADAAHYRAEAKAATDRWERLGDTLRHRLQRAVDAGTADPGNAGHIIAVHWAEQAYKAWEESRG
jgi:predicted phage gp36 major capsid-like protein